MRWSLEQAEKPETEFSASNLARSAFLDTPPPPYAVMQLLLGCLSLQLVQRVVVFDDHGINPLPEGSVRLTRMHAAELVACCPRFKTPAFSPAA
jgi:hypothetical protein